MSASKTLASAGTARAPEIPAMVVPSVVAAGSGSPAGAAKSVQRRRARATISADEAAHGAAPEEMARPAGEVLGAVPWSGASPDPDALDAVTFLAWL